MRAMRVRRRLTSAEDRALSDLVRLVVRFIHARVHRNAPERVSVLPGVQARMILDVNEFLARAFGMLSEKAEDSAKQPLFKKEAATFMVNALNALSEKVREKLMGAKPITVFYLVGQEAQLYFSVLAYAHDRWAMIRKNYIETSKDVAAATTHSARVLWIVRSLVNVGHPPVEGSKFLP